MIRSNIVNLSKSKYIKGVQCSKILWLDKNKPKVKEEENNFSLETGARVGEIAKDLFGKHINIEYNDNLNIMIDNTKKALLQEEVVVTEASFNIDNNFCSIDILKKKGNNYEIYEVKSSTSISDIYLDDISYQVYVLKKLKYNVTGAYIVHLNSDYMRHGDLELDKLFKIEEVTKKVLGRQDKVKEIIDTINKVMDSKKEPSIDIGIYCVKPYNCPYFKYCSRNIPENNVFKIVDMKKTKKFKLYKNGIYTYDDLLQSDIDDKYKQQIEFELYDKEDYINKERIREFMNTLSYPLYFLDFETYQEAIPVYDYVKPYTQIPFQYSLHYYEKKDKSLQHKEFLAEPSTDPRRMLAESLVKDIPENVCTLAYNMMFEKMVIKYLASIYPDLSSHLMNIYNNMHDLMIPFKNRDYYNKDMQGSYSIKYVLPALFPNDPSLDYHNLNLIHNGSEAMNTFANLSSYSKEEQEKIRKCLLKYCELDTYAMVKIFDKLKEI